MTSRAMYTGIGSTAEMPILLNAKMCVESCLKLSNIKNIKSLNICNCINTILDNFLVNLRTMNK